MQAGVYGTGAKPFRAFFLSDVTSGRALDKGLALRLSQRGNAEGEVSADIWFHRALARNDPCGCHLEDDHSLLQRDLTNLTRFKVFTQGCGAPVLISVTIGAPAENKAGSPIYHSSNTYHWGGQEGIDSGVSAPGFQSQEHLLLALCPWASCLTTLCLNFLIWKTWVIIVSIS